MFCVSCNDQKSVFDNDICIQCDRTICNNCTCRYLNGRNSDNLEQGTMFGHDNVIISFFNTRCVLHTIHMIKV